MRALRWLLALAVLAGAVGFFVTRGAPVPAAYDTLVGDAEAGAVTFAAAGCASCHVAPDAEFSETPVLAGGQRFETEFGTFLAPNISPSGAGIGDWTNGEIIHAVRAGVSPSGAHYYPALPYTSYAKADPQDLADIVTFLRTLPASETESLPHEVGFPFNIRRALGGWKLLFMSEDYVLEEAGSDEIARGRYLVEALGHCGECHTPRNALGALDTGNWMGGAPNPNGDGTIPNISPGGLSWSAAEIAEYLNSGFTPMFDTAGGEMAEVVQNTAMLSDADRAAMAAYLKAIPAVAAD